MPLSEVVAPPPPQPSFSLLPLRTDTVRNGGSGFTRGPLPPLFDPDDVPAIPPKPLGGSAKSSGSVELLEPELLLLLPPVPVGKSCSRGLAGASRGLNKDSNTRDSSGEDDGDTGLDTEFNDS